MAIASSTLLMKILAVSLSVLLACFLFSIRSFNSSAAELPGGRVDGIHFENSRHGFIQMLQRPRVIFETRDGGKSWNTFDHGAAGFCSGRSFANEEVGWSNDESLWDHGKLFGTHDGGESWELLLDTGNKSDFVFGGIQAISKTEVWAVGISGAYHSIDGGKTWKKEGPHGTGLQFLTVQEGWIEGDELWKTEDGGKHWTVVDNLGKRCFGGLGFFFLNAKEGWAVGGETKDNMEGGAQTGLFTVTKDGGMTCRTSTIPGRFLWSVYFQNEREGWAGAIGSVIKTQDGGLTWTDMVTEENLQAGNPQLR